MELEVHAGDLPTSTGARAGMSSRAEISSLRRPMNTQNQVLAQPQQSAPKMMMLPMGPEEPRPRQEQMSTLP